jgi:hypothetical protein
VYSTVVYGDKIYVVGDYAELSYWENGGLAINGRVSSMVQVYDPEEDVWSVVTRGDCLFYSHFQVYLLSTSGVYAPSELYLLYNPYRASIFSYYVLGVFDWGSNEWVYGEGVCRRLPSERVGSAVVVLDDLVYVIGGDTISFDAPYGIPQWHIYTASALVERYVPGGYGTVAPEVLILSPESMGAYVGGVSLVFEVSRPVVWVGYSLDGQANVTVSGNATLSGLSGGVHNVVVFVEDAYGNVGVSDVVVFSVSFVPFVLLFIGVCVVVVVGVSLFLFLRKRKRMKSFHLV